MIEAKVFTDGHVLEVEFDAEPWFRQAPQEEIVELSEEKFCCSYVADGVARFAIQGSVEMERFFWFLEKSGYGFECRVDGVQALRWLNKNRPEVYASCDKYCEEDDEEITAVEFNQRELAAVLAGLRALQRYSDGRGLHLSIENILTDSGRLERITNEEIDALCERINE